MVSTPASRARGKSSEHVRAHEDRFAAAVVDLPGDALALLLGELGDHDRGSLAGQRLGVSLTNPPAGSGYDRDLVLESIAHAFLPASGRAGAPRYSPYRRLAFPTISVRGSTSASSAESDGISDGFGV